MSLEESRQSAKGGGGGTAGQDVPDRGDDGIEAETGA